MPCRMRCRLLPSRRVSLEALSSFVAKCCACKRRRSRQLENVLLRRRSSSSFTRASREPMAASVAGSGQHAQRQVSIMTVVSPASSRAEVKRRGRIGSGALHETAKEEEARRRPRLHEAWLVSCSTWMPRARHRQGTPSGESILRYGRRLRYHLAPDLRLTSRGASLAGKRPSNRRPRCGRQPSWVDFPCITAAVSHTSRVVESSALAANQPPCLSSSLEVTEPRAPGDHTLLASSYYGGNGDLVRLRRARPCGLDRKLYQC